MPCRTFWIIVYILIFGINGIIRIFLRDYARFILTTKNKKAQVVIYGAGEAGAQLINSIKTNSNYKIKYIIDDNKDLWKREINGLKIYPPEYFKKNKSNIDYVLFAIPSMPLFKKKI